MEKSEEAIKNQLKNKTNILGKIFSEQEIQILLRGIKEQREKISKIPTGEKTERRG